MKIRTWIISCLASVSMILFSSSASGQAISAAIPSDPAKLLHDSERRLEAGRTTLDEQTLTDARKGFTECVRLQDKNAQCYYDLARTEGYLEQVKQVQKDKNGARHWIDSAIEDAQHAVALEQNSSDAHALLADLYGNKIGLGGMFTGAQYGPKVNAECERALQLDPHNPRAYLVTGHKYLFTPKMFGGNLDKALEAFQKATTLDPHLDEAFVWLAIACRKKGNAQAGETALAEALRLNPQSAFAKRVQAGAME